MKLLKVMSAVAVLTAGLFLFGCGDSGPNTEDFSAINVNALSPANQTAQPNPNNFTVALSNCAGASNADLSNFVNSTNTISSVLLLGQATNVTANNGTLQINLVNPPAATPGLQRTLEINLNAAQQGITLGTNLLQGNQGGVNQTFVAYTENGLGQNVTVNNQPVPVFRTWATTAANPGGAPGPGNISVVARTGNQLTLRANNLQLTPRPIQGNQAVGTVCVNGDLVVNVTNP